MTLISIATILLGLFFFELLYFKVAVCYNIIDRPNSRSSHTTATIRGGGVIFGFSVIIFFCLFNFQYPFFLIGLLLVGCISFVDDILTLDNKIRIGIHLLAVVLLFYQLQLFSLSWYWLIIIAVFVIGAINAYNFMDGINGITGAYSLAIIGTLWYMNYNVISFISQELLTIVGLALVVFNFFNFRTKARCFAGDVGSVSIAFIVLFCLLQLIIKTGNVSYLFLLLVYGLDAITTIIFRLIRKENIFAAHRSHFYQYLANELKIPQLAVSLGYVITQLLVNILILIWLPESIYIVCLYLFFSALFFLIVRFSVEGPARLFGY